MVVLYGCSWKSITLSLKHTICEFWGRWSWNEWLVRCIVSTLVRYIVSTLVRCIGSTDRSATPPPPAVGNISSKKMYYALTFYVFEICGYMTPQSTALALARRLRVSISWNFVDTIFKSYKTFDWFPFFRPFQKLGFPEISMKFLRLKKKIFSDFFFFFSFLFKNLKSPKDIIFDVRKHFFSVSGW